jgi:hypothetical protein
MRRSVRPSRLSDGLDALDPEIETTSRTSPKAASITAREGVREAFRIWPGTWEDYCESKYRRRR